MVSATLWVLLMRLYARGSSDNVLVSTLRVLPAQILERAKESCDSVKLSGILTVSG